jgi:hypothetical protein
MILGGIAESLKLALYFRLPPLSGIPSDFVPAVSGKD